MHLTSHIIDQMAMPLTSYIIAQMDLTSGFGNISFEWNSTHQTLTDHRSKFAKRGKREMCSFGSCQTRFEFLSQFWKVRNAFECFVTQVQTRLPKTKRVWPMKINVLYCMYDINCVCPAPPIHPHQLYFLFVKGVNGRRPIGILCVKGYDWDISVPSWDTVCTW